VRKGVILVGLVAFASVVGTVAVLRTSTRTHAKVIGLVTVEVSSLPTGGVETTPYTVSAVHDAPVFVVNAPQDGFVALVGRSTHLGCRIKWVHAASYRRFETHASVAFEDPCGGSLFALNGACVGGPCPRALDRLATTRTGRSLRINLHQITRGRARDPRLVPLPD
jgi:Rieske Fe-S protein